MIHYTPKYNKVETSINIRLLFLSINKKCTRDCYERRLRPIRIKGTELSYATRQIFYLTGAEAWEVIQASKFQNQFLINFRTGV